MALSDIHNYKFQYSFTDDEGRACVLQLIPGYETNLNSPATQEFPVASFLNNIVIKRNFDNDLPIGLEMTPTMELTVNIEQFEGTFDTTKNWLDVAIQIIRGRSILRRVVTKGMSGGGVDPIYIPNRWTLTRAGVIIFDGFQDSTPEKELSADFKVTVSGAFHSIAKKITGEGNYLLATVGFETYKYLLEILYHKAGYTIGSYYKGFVLMKSHKELVDYYRDAFINYEAAYYRAASHSLMNYKGTSNILLASGNSGSSWVLILGSNQNITLGMSVTGTGIPANTRVILIEDTDIVYLSESLTAAISSEPLTFQQETSNILENIKFSSPSTTAEFVKDTFIDDNLNSLFMCVSATRGGKITGGFMRSVDDKHGLSKYKSLYDVFQEGISNNLLKARIDYDASNISLNIVKCLDNFTYDNLGEPIKTITKGYGTKTVIDYKMPASVKSTKLMTGDNDLTEIEIVNNGSDSSDTVSIEPKIQNDISVVGQMEMPQFRYLYEQYLTFYRKVHPAITLWLGMGYSYTNTESGIDAFGASSLDIWTKKNNPIIIERQKLQGITYTTAFALNELLKNQNIKIELETREIDILDFGERISLDSAAIENFAHLPEELKEGNVIDKCMIYSCEYDVKTCWNKLQLFISGIK